MIDIDEYHIHEIANFAILGQSPKLAVFQDRPIIRWLTRLKYHRHRYDRTLHERIWTELNWQREHVLSDACFCRRCTEIEAPVAFFLELFDNLAVRRVADALEVAAMNNRPCEHQRSRNQVILQTGDLANRCNLTQNPNEGNRMRTTFLMSLAAAVWIALGPVAVADGLSGNWSGPWYRGMTSGIMTLKIDEGGGGLVQFTNLDNFGEDAVPITSVEKGPAELKFTAAGAGADDFTASSQLTSDGKVLKGDGEYDGFDIKFKLKRR